MTKKGGYGNNWGGGWGGTSEDQIFPPAGSENFTEPSYDVPKGVRLGNVDIDRFSGEPESGPLSDAAGAIFFSPSLLEENDDNEIDVDSIQVSVHGSDVYERPPEGNGKVFTWGPGSGRTNNPRDRTQPEAYTVIGTMVQTIPPGPTTIFKIP